MGNTNKYVVIKYDKELYVRLQDYGARHLPEEEQKKVMKIQNAFLPKEERDFIKQEWVASGRVQFLAKLPQETHREFLATYIPENIKNLLEVGCAQGMYLELYTKLRPEIDFTGLDQNINLVKTAVGRGFNVIEGDMHDMPFEDNSFDCIMSCDVFEHSMDPNKLLGECRRIVREDGWLVFAVPPDARVPAAWWNNPEHCWKTDMPDVYRRLEKAGFEIEHMIEYSLSQFSRAHPPSGGCEILFIARPKKLARPKK